MFVHGYHLCSHGNQFYSHGNHFCQHRKPFAMMFCNKNCPRSEDSHKEGGNSKQLVEGQARSRSRLRCGAGSRSARCDNKDRGRYKQLHESSEQVDSFCRHWNQGYCWWENGSCNFQHRCSKELLMGEFCRSQRHGENEHRVTL